MLTQPDVWQPWFLRFTFVELSSKEMKYLQINCENGSLINVGSVAFCLICCKCTGFKCKFEKLPRKTSWLVQII